MNYILAAIHTVENYVQSLEIPLRYYHIELTSELDSPTGKIRLRLFRCRNRWACKRTPAILWTRSA